MTSPERTPLIAPSILSADFSRLGDEVRALDRAGADWIHVDVMDGRFVPNLTIGPMVVQALRPCTTRFMDCHLMIVEPERYVEAFAAAGADAITVHVEACPHLHRNLQQIRSLRHHAGGRVWAAPQASFAFKNSMIRGILQFTLRIAFRCVLHRYESQDIHC